MTPTPKQGLFDLIPPYWATFLSLSCIWVGLLEMSDPQALMAFACFSASFLGIVWLFEHVIIQERAHIAATLDVCCDSFWAATLATNFRKLQVYQVLLVVFACSLNRLIAWGVA